MEYFPRFIALCIPEGQRVDGSGIMCFLRHVAEGCLELVTVMTTIKRAGGGGGSS